MATNICEYDHDTNRITHILGSQLYNYRQEQQLVIITVFHLRVVQA